MRKKTVCILNLIAAICFAICCYGYFYHANTALGVINLGLSLSQLILFRLNYREWKREQQDQSDQNEQ